MDLPLHKQVEPLFDTINSRVNRVTKLAANEVSKKHVSRLRSLAAEKSAKLVENLDFKLETQFGYPSKVYHSKKGTKGQNFIDEIFTIRRIATFNPPTYKLTDANGEIF